MSTPDPEIERVLNELVPERTGDLAADLCTAGREVMERRRRNSDNGGKVFAALRAQGMSWRQIEDCTGVSIRTARRWADPPPDDETTSP